MLEGLYVPKANTHKGQNGKLLIIGGSKKYSGALIFSLLSARRFVDLLYLYPGEKDSYLISAAKAIPEAIVVDNLTKLKETDCVLFGIGLAKAKFDIKILNKAKKLVIDGDGLRRIKNKIPKNAILTPHEDEFTYLFALAGTKENVRKMARLNNCIILKKDPKGDIISDGKKIKINKMHNQGMTKGGTGDVLSGLLAALACKNDAFRASCAAAYINGYAGNMLRKKYGFNFSASDLADKLSEAVKEIRLR